jgi:adenylate kinase
MLVGMPGAGKGTLSGMLKTRLGIECVCASDLLRAVDPASKLGKEIAGNQAAGRLNDDVIVNQVMESAFGKARENLVIDGYPRQIGQAEHALRRAAELGFEAIAVFLAISEAVAAARRDKRLRDAAAAGVAARRDDADPNVLVRRFAEYHGKTEPMIDWLREKLGADFYKFDNSGSPEDLYEKVVKVLNLSVR